MNKLIIMFCCLTSMTPLVSVAQQEGAESSRIIIQNKGLDTIYAFQYVRPLYQVVDFVVDGVELVTGVEELKAALVEVEELPAEINSIRHLFKYFQYLRKVHKKEVALTKDATTIANKVFSYFKPVTIAIAPGQSVNILDQDLLGYLSASGLAELLGASTITVSLMAKHGELGLQYQTPIGTVWNVVGAGVTNPEGSITYLWHGNEENKFIEPNWRPAMVAHEDLLYVVGCGYEHSTWWSSWDGDHWSYPTHLEGIFTKEGVTLTEWNGDLYAAWKKVDSDTVLLAHYQDGYWDFLGPIPGCFSAHTPSLYTSQTIGGIDLFIAWRGTGDDANIYRASKTDGLNWKIYHVVGQETSLSPAVTRVITGNGFELSLSAWRNVADDRILSANFYTPQPAFLPHQVVTSSTPALTFNPATEAAYCAWKGAGLDSTLYFTVAPYGRSNYPNWTTSVETLKMKSTDGPALGVFQEEELFLTWKDPFREHAVLWSSYDGEQWSIPLPID